MKTLNQKEWIAVVVAIFVIGFFFIFGQIIISVFNKNGLPVTQNTSTSKPQVLIQDETIGTGNLATDGKMLTINYTGRFVNGTIFDSSLNRGEPFQFALGRGQVIAGLDEGLVGMKVGGKRIISIPPELGYGPNDYGPIPGNSTLIFEVELLKVQ